MRRRELIDPEDFMLSPRKLIDGRAADRAETEDDGVEWLHGVIGVHRTH